jgi:hypothetical protein
MTDTIQTGAAATLPSVVEITLSNGLRVWTHAVSQRDNLRLIQEWEAKNPAPNKDDYRLPVPPDMASFEGQMLAPEENPVYQQLLKDRKTSLNDHIIRAYLLGYVEFPDTTEDELIAKHAKAIARKRRVMDVPDDAWEATLLFALVDDIRDYQLLVNAVQRNLTVDEGEVIDEMRIFRPVNRGRTD